MTCLAGPADPCLRPDFAACATLSDMVDLFLASRGDREERERLWYGDHELTPEEALRRAMFTLERDGVRDGHQRPYSTSSLRDLGERLADRSRDLTAATDFGDLYRRIEQALGVAPDGRPLLIYDVALRFGRWLGHEPKAVWLHAGPRLGANALRPGLARSRHRPLAEFPTSIRTRLSAAQAEDFLCLAARVLHPGLWD
jgi:hypothetical protein